MQSVGPSEAAPEYKDQFEYANLVYCMPCASLRRRAGPSQRHELRPRRYPLGPIVVWSGEPGFEPGAATPRTGSSES